MGRTEQSYKKKSVDDFSKTLKLPAQILVIHCRHHIGQKDKVSKSSNLTDRTAKAAVKAWQTANIEPLI